MRHDEDWDLRSAEYAFRDTADEERMKAAVTVGAEHDDIGAEVLDLPQDRLHIRPAKGMRVRRETLLRCMLHDRLDASMLFAKCRRDLIAHVLWTHLVPDEVGFGFTDMQHVELAAEGFRQ
jgi:hypothetical protein